MSFYPPYQYMSGEVRLWFQVKINAKPLTRTGARGAHQEREAAQSRLHSHRRPRRRFHRRQHQERDQLAVRIV